MLGLVDRLKGTPPPATQFMRKIGEIYMLNVGKEISQVEVGFWRFGMEGNAPLRPG
jgi:hypothetical protein